MRAHRVLPAIFLAGMFALSGCAPSPSPVSDKVQKYYDENVANQGKQAASASPSAAPAAPKSVVFIGDSYAQGTGASAPNNRWTTKLSFALGWTEHNLARGGTGYLVSPTDPKSACGLDYCPSYAEMIPEAVKEKPNVIVVSGGRNDIGAGNAQFSDAATDFYTKLRAALPDARIITLDPLWDASKPPGQLAAYSDSVRAAVTAVKGEYIDIKQPLNGHPDWVIADGVHPSDSGHDAIYRAAKDAIPTR